MIRDKNGREIREGDVLKVFHFTGARRKRYYMYKLVAEFNGVLCGVDIGQLATKPRDEAHRYQLRAGDMGQTEIVEGFACKEGETSFEDRPRLRTEADVAESEAHAKHPGLFSIRPIKNPSS